MSGAARRGGARHPRSFRRRRRDAARVCKFSRGAHAAVYRLGPRHHLILTFDGDHRTTK